MFRRYVLPIFLILALAFGSAVGAAKAYKKTTFSSFCVFQAAIYLSRNPPQTPDHQEFISTLALQEVGAAVASGVYTRVATAEGLDPGTILGKITTAPAPGLGALLVNATDADRPRAIRLANAACEEFVTTIKNQRKNEIARQLENVQNRIVVIQAELRRLESIPPNQRTATDNILIQSQRAALQSNTVVIANISSLPPDDIGVLSHASTAIRKESGGLRRNLVVAGVGGLLACFLYILVIEAFTDRRRTLVGASDPVTSEISRSGPVA